MDKVRLGIIGFGNQGSIYAQFLEEGKVKDMVLGAICDIDPEKKKLAQEKYPSIPFYDNYLDMLDSGNVDAIVTTVPHYLHPEMAIESLKRDIHALVEKPAGVYTKQVREMNEFAATKPELTFAIMFNQRTNPLYQKVKEIVENGELGELRRVNWIITDWWRPQTYYDSSEWRATWGGEGGGVLVNQAPHQIDMLQWICGMPKKVFAKARYGYHRDIVVENDVTAVFDFENGATGVFTTCTHDIVGTNRLEIYGDKGKVIVENDKLVLKKLTKPEQELSEEMDMMQVYKLVQGGDTSALYTEETFEFGNQWGGQHIAVLENFAANILHGTPLIADGAEGIRGVELASAMLLSSWLEKEVELPFDEDLYLEELNKRIKEENKYPTRE